MYHNIVVLSGGFDPVHEGHIAMFRDASTKYDRVIVGVNSDDWLIRKKGKAFMTSSARKTVLEAISYIDTVVEFDDSDNSAIDLLRRVKHTFPGSKITFGNGGDRSSGNYPEFRFCCDNKILIDDSLGGATKQNSSSKLLDNWSTEKQERPWGYWRVLYEYPDNKTKVKELVVKPGCALSWQKHFYRSELWYIKTGIATLYRAFSSDKPRLVTVPESAYVSINVLEWHRLENNTKNDITVLEIQSGDRCIETDIERAPFCI